LPAWLWTLPRPPLTAKIANAELPHPNGHPTVWRIRGRSTTVTDRDRQWPLRPAGKIKAEVAIPGSFPNSRDQFGMFEGSVSNVKDPIISL
jgi:hypothetical protein